MNKEINVALLGVKGDFSRSEGEGVLTYMYEMYKNFSKIKGVNSEKIEFDKSSFLERGISFMLSCALANFAKYEIIHNLGARAAFPRRKGRALLISTAHDFQPVISPEQMIETDRITERLKLSNIRYEMRLQFLRTFSLRSVLESDYIICRSTLTKQDAISLGYDKKRAFVENNGIDQRYFKKVPKKKETKQFKVGYIGALRKRKNVGFAVNAFKTLNDTKTIFEIWGKKAFDYQKLKESASGDKRIRFMGFAPEERIVEIYDGFDAFVFPTLYEGLGAPIREAQARGLPVIIYKNGKLPDEIKRYCFQAEDEEHMGAIIEELKANGYADHMREKAIKYARSFTWEKGAETTAKIYSNILNHQ